MRYSRFQPVRRTYPSPDHHRSGSGKTNRQSCRMGSNGGRVPSAIGSGIQRVKEKAGLIQRKWFMFLVWQFQDCGPIMNRDMRRTKSMNSRSIQTLHVRTSACLGEGGWEGETGTRGMVRLRLSCQRMLSICNSYSCKLH